MITAAAQLFDDVQAIPSRDCRFCGKPFLSVDQRVYCSNVCRSRRKYSSPRRRERAKERREHASMLGPHDRHVRVYRKWLKEEQAAARVARLGWERRAEDEEHRQALSWGSAQVEYGGYGWNTQRCNICHAEFIAGRPRVTCGDAECLAQMEVVRTRGLRKERRDEINARRRARHASNPEHANGIKRRWIANNKEHYKETRRRHAENNPDYVERLRQAHRLYQTANREKIRERYWANIETIKERARLHRQAHREEINAYCRARRAALIATLSPDDPRHPGQYYRRNRERIAAYMRDYHRKYYRENREQRLAYEREHRREYKEAVRAAVLAYRELTGVIERDDWKWRNAVVIYKALQQFMEGEEANEHATHRDESTGGQRDAAWPSSGDDTACAA